MQRGPDLAMARDRRFESTFLQRRIVCEPGLSVGITLERLDCLRRIRGRARRRGLAVGSANQLEERRRTLWPYRTPDQPFEWGFRSQIGRPAHYVLISFKNRGLRGRLDDDITPQDRVTDPLRSPAVYGDGVLLGGIVSVYRSMNEKRSLTIRWVDATLAIQFGRS